MAKKPTVLISAEEFDQLTDIYTDTEIAERLQVPKTSVTRKRVYYGVKSFTEKTGLIKVKGKAMTKEERMLNLIRPLAPTEHVLKGLPNPKVRTHSFDERFFKDIDSEAKAYFLGFIAADGCVYGDNKTVSIAIKDSDVQILEDFKKVLNFTGEVKLHPRNESNSNSYGGSDRVRIRLNSVQMVQDLATHGIEPRKTFTQRMVQTVPFELERHFVRGLWDGDGHIGRTNMIIVSCKPLLVDLNQCFLRHDLPELLLEPVKSVYRLRGRRGDKPVLDWLYKDCEVVLLRKKIAYQTFWR